MLFRSERDRVGLLADAVDVEAGLLGAERLARGGEHRVHDLLGGETARSGRGEERAGLFLRRVRRALVGVRVQDQAQDVVHSTQSWLRRADLDPDRLAEIDARMGLWMSLARRFKRSPDELPAIWTQWKQELAALDEAADLDQLRQKCQAAEEDYRKEARSEEHTSELQSH